MSDQRIPLPTGQQLDSSEVTVAAQLVQRERDCIADPTDPLGIARVKNGPPAPGDADYGVATRPIPRHASGDQPAAPAGDTPFGIVSDTPENYVPGEARPLSLTPGGRLRVATVVADTYLEFFRLPEPFFDLPDPTSALDPFSVDASSPWP